MKALVVEGVFHWGFSVRVPGTSAGGATYPTIPPSTIVGALSRGWCARQGYAVRNGHSCTEDFYINFINSCIEIKNNYPGILFAMYSPYSTYSDLFRQERATYIQSSGRALRDRWFGVSAFGKTYAPSVRFKIYLILKESCKEDSIYFQELKDNAWTVTSLGTKESLVSVTDVLLVSLTNTSTADVYAYFPAECLSQNTGFEITELPTYNVYILQNSIQNIPNIFGRVEKYAVPSTPHGVPRRISTNDLDPRCKIWEVHAVGKKEGIVYYA